MKSNKIVEKYLTSQNKSSKIETIEKDVIVMNSESNIAPINEDLNVLKYETENIKNLIYTIRGKQVMLDSDVAMLYQYTTKNINKAMKRNIDRFPEDFCFQLTELETENLRFHFGTSSSKKKIMEEEDIYHMLILNKEFLC